MEISAILPALDGLPEETRSRFDELGYCYCGVNIPIAAIEFVQGHLIVNFPIFDEDKRWEVANRLSRRMPIYKGLSNTRVYEAGMNYQLKIHIDGITLLTKSPIPDEYLELYK